MNEKEGKEILKWIIENGQKQMSKRDKELIKQAIDESRNWDELMVTLMGYLMVR